MRQKRYESNLKYLFQITARHMWITLSYSKLKTELNDGDNSRLVN